MRRRESHGQLTRKHRKVLRLGRDVGATITAVAVVAACGSSGSTATGGTSAATSASTSATSATTASSGSTTSATSSGSAASLTTVKVPVIPNKVTDVFIPLYVADDLGIAKANGIKFQYLQVESGSALLTSVVAGAAPFSIVPVSTAAEAIAQNQGIETIAVAQPLGAGFILESKAGSGITNVKQLAGKSICVSKPGSETDLYATYTNTTNHLNATIVPVGASGQEPSLLNGKTTACVEAAPQSYDLVNTKKAVQLVNYGTAAPIYGAWIAKKGYAEAHKDLATRVLKTWYEAIAKMQADPSMAVSELEKWNKESPAVAQAEFDNMIKNAPTSGALTAAQVGQTYKVLQAAGTKNLPPQSDLETTAFASVSG